MKKRVKTQPSTSYTSEPAVGRGLMADNPIQQNSSLGLGNRPNRVVPSKLGRMSGVAGFVDKKRPRVVKNKPIANPQKPKSGVIAPRPKVSRPHKAASASVKKLTKLKGL